MIYVLTWTLGIDPAVHILTYLALAFALLYFDLLSGVRPLTVRPWLLPDPIKTLTLLHIVNLGPHSPLLLTPIPDTCLSLFSFLHSSIISVSFSMYLSPAFQTCLCQNAQHISQACY